MSASKKTEETPPDSEEMNGGKCLDMSGDFDPTDFDLCACGCYRAGPDTAGRCRYYAVLSGRWAMTEPRNQDGGSCDPIWDDKFYDMTYNPGDDEEDEVIGWECGCCGYFQENQMGQTCDRCCGPLCEVWG